MLITFYEIIFGTFYPFFVTVTMVGVAIYVEITTVVMNYMMVIKLLFHNTVGIKHLVYQCINLINHGIFHLCVK